MYLYLYIQVNKIKSCDWVVSVILSKKHCGLNSMEEVVLFPLHASLGLKYLPPVGVKAVCWPMLC